MYKALWSTQDASTASGSGADLIAAINRAVADGVDVINYSISGTRTNFIDGVEIAFLNAAAAGVFVSASAGNNGPAVSTVAHPSPWITTVAAETHDRVGAGSALIEGVTYSGRLGRDRLRDRPAGDVRHAGLAGPPLPARTRWPLAAAARSSSASGASTPASRRASRSSASGGIGMILVNPPAGSLNADLHFVPSVHLQGRRYAAIEAAAVAGKTASISGQILFNQPAPFIGGVLVARPARGRRRRPAEAGHRRTGRRRSRCRCPSRAARSRVRPLQRHVDVCVRTSQASRRS